MRRPACSLRVSLGAASPAESEVAGSWVSLWCLPPPVARLMTKRRYWTAAEIRTLKRLYPDVSNPDIGRRLRRTEPAVQLMALKLGLRKSPEFMASPACRFQKGVRPWNLGVTGYMGANRTSFGKGHLPHNHRSVGSERVTDGVLMRKVVDTRRRSDWKPVKDIIWEERRGRIPKGRFVRLKKPGGPLTLRNLELVDRAANMRRNTYHRYPANPASRRPQSTDQPERA